MLDGADIAQFSRSQLVNWIGYVPQETVLFAGSVRDNIAYGNPKADDDQIIKAATAAGVHKFIIYLPDGYASEIGEAGQRLSGGQRQRIAIARALVSDPVVLLLDEPSSNLDRQAEEEIRDTLKGLAEEHTIILVSHSPVLLQGCDNLIALDRGKIALAGPAKDILPRLFGTGKKKTAPAKPKGPDGSTPSGIPKPEPKASGGIPKPAPKAGGGIPKPAPRAGGGIPKPAQRAGGGIPKPAARTGGGIPKPAKRVAPPKAPAATPVTPAKPAKHAIPAAASKRVKPPVPIAAKPSEPPKAEKLFKSQPPSTDIEIEPDTTITTISSSSDD